MSVDNSTDCVPKTAEMTELDKQLADDVRTDGRTDDLLSHHRALR